MRLPLEPRIGALRPVLAVTARSSQERDNADEMKGKRYIGRCVRGLEAAVVSFVAVYAAYVGVAWYRYGHAQHAGTESSDRLLDSLIPAYDVAGHQEVFVAAPAQPRSLLDAT
jgi:hypothetical protein